MEAWFSYGETAPSMELKSIYGVNGSLGFDDIGGPKYLEINAGDKTTNGQEEAIQKLLALKEPNNFNQFSAAKLAEDNWHLETSPQAGPLNLGFIMSIPLEQE